VVSAHFVLAVCAGDVNSSQGCAPSPGVCVCVCVCERERERERDRVPCVRALELDVGCACGKIDVPKIMYTLNTVCLQVQSLGIARGRL
jgi:hypothetical protein